MALQIGDSECTFGLAKRVLDNMRFSMPSVAAQQEPHPELKAMAHSIASAVVAELVENGVVVLTASAGATPVTGTGAIT